MEKTIETDSEKRTIARKPKGKKSTASSTKKSGSRSIASLIRQYYPEYWNKIDSFPAEKCACIRKVKEEWGEFGNFFRAPLMVNGMEFINSEQLYQMMKFRDVDLLKRIHADKSMGMKMRARSKEAISLLRPDWGGMLIDAMKFCLVQKYQQCEIFRNELERSKQEGLYIVEDETSRKHGKPADAWGTVLVGNQYVGPNLLGKLLMELRDTGKLEYHLPDDALDFIELLKK